MPDPTEPSCHIRSAEPRDVDWMHGLEKRCFPDDFWPRSAFQSEFLADLPPIVCEVGGSGVGYVCLMAGPLELHITNLAVDPVWRRLGIGRQLVGAAIAEAARRRATQIFLDVRPSNHAAKKLYNALGFVELYRRRGYYIKPSEDGLVLARSVAARDLDGPRPDRSLKG
jgi:ribosomal-protein-alanine N-acetyltransferase